MSKPRPKAPKRLHLNYFHRTTGHHDSAWRLPESDSEYGMSIQHHIASAKAAEAACFDSVFLAHHFGGYGMENLDHMHWDPTLVLAAVAAHTRHIGLIATSSTTFRHPFDVAQKFATLDQLSGGRAAWNMVTTGGDLEAQNFGLDNIPEGPLRYQRAAEFVEVCKKLWNSWDDDAVVADKEEGLFVDTGKVHAIDHEGEHFRVRGPLHLRPRNGGPVLVQAGSSEAGKAFAARYADVIFTIQPEIEDARVFYAEMKSRAAALGRAPESLVIMPGLAPLLGPTEAEAHRREKELAELVSPERGLVSMERWLGVDFSPYPLDGPVPPLPDPTTHQQFNRTNAVVEYVRRENPTLRQLAGMIAAGRGHHVFVGTGEQLADHMEEWIRTKAADGFNLMPFVLPRGLHEFIDEVIPILTERELFRSEYEGTTLRDRYGLNANATDRVSLVS